MLRNKTQWIIILFVVVAAFFRLVPHIPNVTPITAMALFSGVYFSNRKLAFIVPLSAMFLSDLFLGLTTISIFVYLGFVLVGMIGMITRKMNLKSILLSSILFFLITNFGVWLLSYPKSISGIIECYTLAIPFFRNALIGDLFFAGVMYYGYEFVSKRIVKTA
ncbi:DUF6580 family putative transport protein [Aestuariivivens sediminicola]|uniref:DUF6580 family putative transport protein n=1 Tax=Aestuariivivens sediminicola TaxID=2913560 RepID=UPI001F57A5B3|nr:DUF6580 family putative transport protein [Aestuariivivens sediminicola]